MTLTRWIVILLFYTSPHTKNSSINQFGSNFVSKISYTRLRWNHVSESIFLGLKLLQWQTHVWLDWIFLWSASVYCCRHLYCNIHYHLLMVLIITTFIKMTVFNNIIAIIWLIISHYFNGHYCSYYFFIIITVINTGTIILLT